MQEEDLDLVNRTKRSSRGENFMFLFLNRLFFRTDYYLEHIHYTGENGENMYKIRDKNL